MSACSEECSNPLKIHIHKFIEKDWTEWSAWNTLVYSNIRKNE